ncbi:reactive intermediate/imine deaminase [bacterium 336/3]|nr:reactive intermediate/imine deaminase [bacterium 336/3]
MKKVIFSEKAPTPIGPYSQAIQFGNELFVSGQIALKNGVMIQDNIQNETHQVMKNLQAILEAAEMTFDNIVKCTIFVKDLNNFQAINEVYGTYFEANPPARETVEVSRLPKDANVEISCIAFK